MSAAQSAPPSAGPSRPAVLLGVLGRGIVDADEPALSARDLGAVRGDGCFETTRITVESGGRVGVDHLDLHLIRLAASAAALDLPMPDVPVWRELLDELIDGWPAVAGAGSAAGAGSTVGEAALRIVLTRGLEFGDGTPTGWASISPISATVLGQRRSGVAAVTLSRGVPLGAYANAPWLLGGVKSVSYALNMAALREAGRRGAQDAIYVSTDGYLLEAPTSNVMWSDGANLFAIPPGSTGILAGITQRTLLAHAASGGLEPTERLGVLADLLGARAVWLVSSVRGIAEVTELDGQALSVDHGLTRRLRKLAGFPI